LHIEGTFSSVIGKQEIGDYLPFIPANKVRYEIRAERKKLGFLTNPNIKISALSAFSQDDPSTYETVTGGYTLVNISAYSEVLVTKQVFIFGISVNNLFDKQYFDHLSTLKALGYFNQGRNINVSLKMPFGIGNILDK